MTTTSVILKSQKGTSTLTRPKFGPGMLLQHEDLDQLTIYTRDLSRLLFRSFFGCGVVCGLTVNATESCGRLMVTIGGGIAMDCAGDPIYVPKDQTFAATDDCDPNDPPPSPLWVVLCATTRCCAPRTPACGCDDQGQPAACTREVDGYEIRIVSARPDCACGCDPEDSTNTVPAALPTNAPGSATNTTANVAPAPPVDPCQCANPDSKCYADHYNGVCGCKCDDCNCVLLARLDHKTNSDTWTTDYSVRRFIRPVLMKDPLAYPRHPAAAAETAPAAATSPMPAKAAKTKTP